MVRGCLSCLALLLLAGSVHAELSITGTLSRFDDEPLRDAYVGLMGQDVRVQRATDESGRFEFTVESPGAYWLWCTGVHHNSLLVPLLVRDELAVDVRLATAGYRAEFDNVRVIGDFNDFADDQGVVHMEEKENGTFMAIIPTESDTLAYQLLGVQEGDQPISGTQADRYAFDAAQPLVAESSGKYVAVVEVEGDSATILFVPEKLPRSDRAAQVVFSDTAGMPARIATAYREIKELQEPFNVAVKRHRESDRDPREFTFDWSSIRKKVSERIAAEPEGLVRQYLLLNLIQLGSSQADSTSGQRVFEEIPPSSAAWSLIWGSPFNTLYTAARLANRPQVVDDYVQQVLESNPDPVVQAAFVYYAMFQAHRSGDIEARRRYYTRLVNEFGDSFFAERAKAQFGREQKIQPGKPVPEFTITDIEDSKKIYSPGYFQGKVYLIDFWAVWCGPCIAEMKHLHEAYERYKDDGFAILSISLDKKREQVDAFRQQKWPMPWNHAFADASVRNEIATAFEVAGIPKPILVGRDGKIVATQADLRGPKLLQTIGTFLSSDPAGN